MPRRNARPSPSEPVAVQLGYAKETPGTYVYKTDDPAAVIKQQYVSKAAFPNGPPDRIMLTVQAL